MVSTMPPTLLHPSASDCEYSRTNAISPRAAFERQWVNSRVLPFLTRVPGAGEGSFGWRVKVMERMATEQPQRLSSRALFTPAVLMILLMEVAVGDLDQAR